MSAPAKKPKKKKDELKERKKKVAGIEVDLHGTLQLFGTTQGFNEQRYMQEYYKVNAPSNAPVHQEELKYVEKHYGKFIKTARLVLAMDSDMSKCENRIREYKTSLASMADISLSFEDAKFFKEQQKREQDPEYRRDNIIGDELLLEELSQDLRSLMYERKFEKAVSTIEEAYGRDMLKADPKDTPAAQQLKQEIEERVVTLVDTLTDDLKSPNRKKYERRRIIGFLVRLKRADKALHIFLQNRSLQIKQEIRQINFQGDISLYVRALSRVVFDAIGSTCLDFHHLFPSNAMMSAVVVWAIEELEQFGYIFKKQVFQTEGTLGKLAKCLKFAFGNCWTLEQKGLSLSFVLARMFTGPLLQMIKQNYKNLETRLADHLQHEQWKVEEWWVKGTKRAEAGDDEKDGKEAKEEKEDTKGGAGPAGTRALKLTSSAKALYKEVGTLLKEVVPLMDNQVYPAAANDLYPAVVFGMVRLFDDYITVIATQARNQLKNLSETQSLSIVANTYYLADDLLPRVAREFASKLGRDVPELETFRVQLLETVSNLSMGYCNNRVPLWLEAIIFWRTDEMGKFKSRYASTAELKEPVPSQEFCALVKYISDIRGVALQCLPRSSVDQILTFAMEEILRWLQEEKFIKELHLGLGGLTQLVLDVRLLVRSAGQYLNKRGEALSQLLIDKLFKRYCDITREKEDNVRKAFKFHDNVIDAKITDSKFPTIGKMLEKDMKEQEEKERVEKQKEVEDRKRRDDQLRQLAERERGRRLEEKNRGPVGPNPPSRGGLLPTRGGGDASGTGTTTGAGRR